MEHSRSLHNNVTEVEKTPIDEFLDANLDSIEKNLVDLSQRVVAIKLERIPGSLKFSQIEKELMNLTESVKARSKEYKIMEIKEDYQTLPKK